MSKSVDEQIKTIFENNKIKDLNYFLSKRKCLNTCNQVNVYLFHIIQSAGILTTTIATGYQITPLIWTGVGLNILASLIHVFEKTNNSISLKLLKDIELIKLGNYIDESICIDLDDFDKSKRLISKNEV